MLLNADLNKMPLFFIISSWCCCDVWPRTLHRADCVILSVGFRSYFCLVHLLLYKCNLLGNICVTIFRCRLTFRAFYFSLMFIFTARRYASAVYAVIVSVCPSVRPSVRLSVCLSQVGVLQRRLNTESHKQCHTIAQRL